MKDKLTQIENKIHQLKQKRERIQTQQATFFLKEAQKILQEEFSLELALNILNDTWTKASKTQKEEWKTRKGSFLFSSHKTRKKAKAHNPAPQQSGKAEAPHHEHP